MHQDTMVRLLPATFNLSFKDSISRGNKLFLTVEGPHYIVSKEAPILVWGGLDY